MMGLLTGSVTTSLHAEPTAGQEAIESIDVHQP